MGSSVGIDVWLGFLRHVLTLVGGILVAKGFGDANMVDQATGGIITLVGVFLSYYNKVSVHDVLGTGTPPSETVAAPSSTTPVANT